jgi:hypothetical protein
MVPIFAAVHVLGLVVLVCAAEKSDALLGTAAAHWRLGDGAQGAKHPLTQVGDFRLNVAAEGEGATVDAKVARLAGAYFDAGQALNLEGDQCEEITYEEQTLTLCSPAARAFGRAARGR